MEPIHNTKNQKRRLIFRSKAIGLFLIFLMAGSFLQGQTIDDIKGDRSYIWGYGMGKNLPIADKNALKDLTSQICTSVESNYKYVITESGGEVQETLEGIIKTYSSTTLTNAQRLVVENDSGIVVFRYIKREELGLLFKKRENRLKGYVVNALNAEKEGRIGDALRYFYWAQVLLYSHPDNQEMTFTFESADYQLFSWLPDRINRLFSRLAVFPVEVVTSGMEQEVIFNITYHDKKAYNMDYSYWNGSDWSSLVGASNGEGIIELFGDAEKSMEELRIKVEYEYVNKAKLDPELPAVIDVIQLPYYKQAEKIIHKNKINISAAISGTADKADEHQRNDQNTAQSNSQLLPVKDSCKCGNKAKTVSNLNALLNHIDGLDKKPVESLFTKEGLEVYQRLIKYGQAKLMPISRDFDVKCMGTDAIVREVPFVFSFPTNNRKFVEKLSIVFDSTGLIKNITFSLNQLSMEGILSHSKWLEASKWQIIHFLENYQTAYALERSEYIDKIFSDDALIIIGKKLEKAEPIDKMYALLKNDQYQYIKVSKKEYMERLKQVFENNEFVNIQFEDCEVKKRDNNSEVYGIQIAQNYYSSSYADQGYLFLMVDMTDTLKPKIYVRSWQPEKNPDGSIIGLGSFFN
ncbi:MAG: LPP20 family lipoprotein [Salinivirgaceae bacterium]|nr:LPP20 family lipoprotein [Salinivirgaceae bacterium]